MDPEQSRLHEMFVCGETMKKRCETTEAFLSECLILESDSEPYKEYDINHVGKETWTKGYIFSVISSILESNLQNSRENIVSSSRCTGLIHSWISIRKLDGNARLADVKKIVTSTVT